MDFANGRRPPSRASGHGKRSNYDAKQNMYDGGVARKHSSNGMKQRPGFGPNHDNGSYSENRNGNEQEQTPVIVFNVTKGEQYTPSKGFKHVNRKLRGQFQVRINDDQVALSCIDDASVFVLAAPQQDFDGSEVKAMQKFVAQGGNMLVLAHEGSEVCRNGQLNSFLELFGIQVNEDAVVRPVYRKDYFHPKEAYISDVALAQCLNRELEAKGSPEKPDGLCIIYPYGATLQVEKPAIPILSSRKIAVPAQRPIAAVSEYGSGRIVVLGSAEMFSDTYINKENNADVLTGIIKLLTREYDMPHASDDAPEYGEEIQVPDTEALAERIQSCLQETEELPLDFTAMFSKSLFSYNMDLLPEAVQLHERLGVKHEQLSLIPPTFEVPHPPLQPAVFLPKMRDLEPPSLDLFDLDQEFASDKIQLAQLTNKCTDEDLEYFVQSAGESLSVATVENSNAASNNSDSKTSDEKSEKSKIVKRSAKEILEFIFARVVDYKKLDPTSAAAPTSATAADFGPYGNSNSMLMNSGGALQYENNGGDIDM
jgi:intraflagellar transport protein 52